MGVRSTNGDEIFFIVWFPPQFAPLRSRSALQRCNIFVPIHTENIDFHHHKISTTFTEEVDSFPKKVDSFPEKVDSRKDTLFLLLVEN